MVEPTQLSQDLCVAPWRAMELVSAFCLAPMIDQGEPDPLAVEIHEDVQKLLGELDVIFTPQNRQNFLLWMKRIDAHRDEYRRTLLLWLDVIEEVAFEIEIDLRENTGPVKLRRVKGAVFYLLEQLTKGLQTPGVPRYLSRFGLHIAIRGTVEFLVTLDNPQKYQQSVDPIAAKERRLWERGREARPRSAFREPEETIIERLRNRLHDSRVFVALLKWWEPIFGKFTDWVLDKFLAPPAVSLRFKRKIDQLVVKLNETIPQDYVSEGAPIQGLFSFMFEGVRWIGKHGKEVRAAIDALSLAFHLTVEMSQLDRDQRIEVVKQALILYFRDRGLSGPYFEFMLRIVVDIGLDALSFLYEKQRDRVVQAQI